MNVKLSKKDLEKSYHLLDVKEINISIADLLFSTFEETEHFEWAGTREEYFKRMLSFWNIPDSPNEDKEIIEKYVKEAIFPLDPLSFINNPYLQSVRPRPIKFKNYSLDYSEYKAYQPFPLDEIKVDETDYKETSPIGFFESDFSYLSITKDNEMWMCITPNEMNTMEPHIKSAKGDVLVLGLGLGYYAYMISLKKEVRDITIIEIDDNVIQLFKDNLFDFFPHKEKIHIIKADAKDYIKNTSNKYDTIFIDLWHNPVDGLPLYLYFKKLEYRFKNCKFQYWLEKSMIALYRRCLLTVYEESLQGYKDKDYLKAKTEIDKIINSIYFKTKNITINSYDDIHNLLSDASILRLLSK